MTGLSRSQHMAGVCSSPFQYARSYTGIKLVAILGNQISPPGFKSRDVPRDIGLVNTFGNGWVVQRDLKGK